MDSLAGNHHAVLYRSFQKEIHTVARRKRDGWLLLYHGKKSTKNVQQRAKQ
jgi:metallophosphoesterase superfamily enzyme